MKVLGTAWAGQRRRYELHNYRRKYSPIRSAKTCMTSGTHAQGDTGIVEVHITESGAGHVKGVKRCGSVAACPICSPNIRATRAEELTEAVRRWHAQGGGIEFVTATVPHHRFEDLATVWDRAQQMWTDAYGSGEGAKAWKEANGVVGLVRAIEVTDGDNGWHVHVHALVFTELRHQLSRKATSHRWRDQYRARGMRFRGRISLDVSHVSPSGGNGVSNYLTKAGSQWGAGLELARSDLKASAGRTPESLLEGAWSGSVRDAERWNEYEWTSKGRRMLVWSRGLRDRIGLGEEISDEEAAAVQPAERVVAVAEVPAELWDEARRDGTLWWLIQAAIRCDELARATGVRYRAPDPPPEAALAA